MFAKQSENRRGGAPPSSSRLMPPEGGEGNLGRIPPSPEGAAAQRGGGKPELKANKTQRKTRPLPGQRWWTEGTWRAHFVPGPLPCPPVPARLTPTAICLSDPIPRPGPVDPQARAGPHPTGVKSRRPRKGVQAGPDGHSGELSTCTGGGWEAAVRSEGTREPWGLWSGCSHRGGETSGLPEPSSGPLPRRARGHPDLTALDSGFLTSCLVIGACEVLKNKVRGQEALRRPATALALPLFLPFPASCTNSGQTS